VRYDSGFAPNPFYGYCTLATCKPDIRKAARVGDWIVGTGSNERRIRRGDHLVYAMCVTDILSFQAYDADPRFVKKKPYRNGSRRQSCGDNIYYRSGIDDEWIQRDSFHTTATGMRHPHHVNRDTRINRVLASSDYIYFGGFGPRIPDDLVDANGRPLRKEGIGRNVFDDPAFIAEFETWFRSLGANGFEAPPYEWRQLRGGRTY
jgi:hypothetical protein